GEMLERMAVGGAELGGEVNVAAEFQHPVVVALENGVGLRGSEIELLEVFRLVRLEGFAVLVLHQRHAEHVDAVALARALGVEHEGAGDVVIVMLRACHRRPPYCRPAPPNRTPDAAPDIASHNISSMRLRNVARRRGLNDSNSSKAASGCRPAAPFAPPGLARCAG